MQAKDTFTQLYYIISLTRFNFKKVFPIKWSFSLFFFVGKLYFFPPFLISIFFINIYDKKSFFFLIKKVTNISHSHSCQLKLFHKQHKTRENSQVHFFFFVIVCFLFDECFQNKFQICYLDTTSCFLTSQLQSCIFSWHDCICDLFSIVILFNF